VLVVAGVIFDLLFMIRGFLGKHATTILGQGPLS
jgi:hypothetical protein